jgi:hypothetical protein
VANIPYALIKKSGTFLHITCKRRVIIKTVNSSSGSSLWLAGEWSSHWLAGEWSSLWLAGEWSTLWLAGGLHSG